MGSIAMTNRAICCWRCLTPQNADDLDECVGCGSRNLCPACMVTHNCEERAAMNEASPRMKDGER